MKKITLEEAQLLWDLGNREVYFKVSDADGNPKHKCYSRPTGKVYVYRARAIHVPYVAAEYFIPSSTSEDS